MKRFYRFTPALTLIAGLAGGTLLRDLLATANDRKLLATDHPAHLLLWLLAGVVLVASLATVFLARQRDYRIFLPFPVQAIGCVCGAVGLGLRLLADDLSPVSSAALVIGMAAMLALAVFFWLGKRPPLLIFALLSAILLASSFDQYRVWGTYTQLQLYLFPGAAALLLAFYSLSYLRLQTRQKPGRSSYIIHQMALVCCLICTGTSQWPYYLAMSLWLMGGLFTHSCKMHLPGDVKKCIDLLEKNGYTAYAVGGCVRDAMLGLKPHDYDLCTSATPEQICQVFAKYELIRNGEKHGTIGVIMDKTVYEITTYRTESTYQDNRHPDQVEFVEELSQDLARRDFTVNAMAYHPEKGYVDLFGGQADLHAGILRAVGDPGTRFQEDALRILRLVRFACRFRMDVDRPTRKAMQKHIGLLDNLAKERVFSELDQILCHMEAGDLVNFRSVFVQVIPELADSVDFQQHNRHHAYDVFTHTDRVIAGVEPVSELRWAALLHDIGKPQCFTLDEQGGGHFLGHAKVSAQLAEDVLHRLKASNQLREQVVFLITHHMDLLPADIKAMRKAIRKYGYDTVKQMLSLQYADQLGKGKKTGKYEVQFDKLLKQARQVSRETQQMSVKDLDVDGHDLMALGFAPGPMLGQCQQMLLDAVISDTIPNDKTELLHKAQEFLNTQLNKGEETE